MFVRYYYYLQLAGSKTWHKLLLQLAGLMHVVLPEAGPQAMPSAAAATHLRLVPVVVQLPPAPHRTVAPITVPQASPARTTL